MCTRPALIIKTAVLTTDFKASKCAKNAALCNLEADTNIYEGKYAHETSLYQQLDKSRKCDQCQATTNSLVLVLVPQDSYEAIRSNANLPAYVNTSTLAIMNTSQRISEISGTP